MRGRLATGTFAVCASFEGVTGREAILTTQFKPMVRCAQTGARVCMGSFGFVDRKRSRKPSRDRGRLGIRRINKGREKVDKVKSE